MDATGAPMRVLVAEADPNVRDLIRSRLGRDPRFEIVGEDADGPSAVALAQRLCPDVALVNVYIPGSGGLEAAARIRARSPRTVVVLTGASPGIHRLAISAGAHYCVGDDPDALDELLEGLAARGGATQRTA